MIKRTKWWIARDGVAVAIVPKCASTGIRNVIGVSDVYSNEEVLQFDTRIAFFRHPIERLRSAFSFYSYLKRKNQLGRPGNIDLSSYEAFVDYVLENDDPHWMPQTELIGDSATHIFKLSDLDHVWPKYFNTGFLPSANRVVHLPTNDYRLDELLGKYEGDLAVWRSI